MQITTKIPTQSSSITSMMCVVIVVGIEDLGQDQNGDEEWPEAAAEIVAQI